MLALVLAVVLARNLGPDGYGIYAYAFAIMNMLLTIAEAGVPSLLMREVASAEGKSDWGILRGALQRGLQTVTIASCAVAISSLILLVTLRARLDTASLYTLALMLLALPFVALTKTVGHGLRGLHRVLTAQSLQLFLRPALALILAALAFWLYPDWRTPYTAMAAQLVAAMTTLLAGLIILGRSLPSKARFAISEYRDLAWFRSARSFLLLGGALVINNQIDTVMLGLFTQPEQIGIYRVAVQGAVLIIFSLQAISAIATPELARLHAQADTEKLQKFVTRSGRMIAIPAILIAGILGIEGKAIITIAFGDAYISAYHPLMILAVGQFLTAILGISGPLLTMTGFEKIQATAIWISVIVNIVLNIILIPLFGATGASIATSSTLIGWIAYLAWSCNHRVGIHVNPFRRTG